LAVRDFTVFSVKLLFANSQLFLWQVICVLTQYTITALRYANYKPQKIQDSQTLSTVFASARLTQFLAGYFLKPTGFILIILLLPTLILPKNG
jgi:hypothetical protein